MSSPGSISTELRDEVLAASGIRGLRAEDVSSEKIHEGVLSEAHRLVGPGLDAVLKLYRTDLARAFAADPDARLHVLSPCLAVPPFFATSRSRIEPLRPLVPVELPEVLGEGVLPSGPWFCLLSHLEGRPWSTATDRRVASGSMGRLLARLHRPELAVDCPWRDAGRWADEYAMALHFLADHGPDALVGDSRKRARLHVRLARIVERFAAAECGPPVLAHMDYNPSNLLVDERGEVCAILDFQLSCIAPTAADFRWLSEVDAETLLEAYGWPRGRWGEARWLGGFFRLLFEALIAMVLHRYSGLAVPDELWASARARVEALLDELEAGSLP